MSAKAYVPNSGEEQGGMGFPMMPPQQHPQLRMPNDPEPPRGKGVMPPPPGGYSLPYVHGGYSIPNASWNGQPLPMMGGGNPFAPPMAGGGNQPMGGQGMVRPGMYPWRG